MDYADGKHFFSEWNLNTSQAFFLAFARVPDAGVGGDHTGIDFKVSLAANEWVGSGLPNIGSHRTGVLIRQFNFALGGFGFDSREFHGAWGEGNEGVQQGLDADVATTGSNEHRDDIAVLDGFAQTEEDLFGSQIAIFKILLEQAVFAFGGGFHQQSTGFFCFCLEVGGDFNRFLSIAFVGFHGDQVYHTFKFCFFAHWQLHRDQACSDFVLDGFESFLVAGVFTVHLVDDHDFGDAESFRVLQGYFRANFETANGINQDESAVRDTHRRNDLADEIGVTGSVEQVEFEILVEHRQNRGKERNAAALFFFVKI